MKYLSIDIETTGLDPEKCDILEIACIIEDTEKKKSINATPVMLLYIDKDYYNFEPEAFEMNFKTMKSIRDEKDQRNDSVCKILGRKQVS